MFISFDIGGTTVKYGVINRMGKIIMKSSMETKDDKSVFITTIKDVIHELSSSYPIEGIGLAVPGIIRKDGYLVTAGAIKSLYGTNLKEELLAYTQLPMTIENDANAAAIAEKWLGSAQNFSNYVCVVLGTGVGGSIVINNQIYAGAHGMAGEFGWTMINELPEVGDLEQATLNKKSAVVNGLCVNYNRLKKQRDHKIVSIFDAQEIFRLEQLGDVVAKEVLDEFFINLAVGLVNIMSSFDPEAILIGGGISANKDFFNRLLITVKEVKSRHKSISCLANEIDIPILSAKLKNDAGMIGVAYQVKNVVDLEKKLSK